MKNMNYGREVIDTDPLGISPAFHVNRHGLSVIFDFLGHSFRNGSNLSKGVAFADNKIIRGSIIQAAEVHFDQVFTFGILDAFDNKVVQFFSGELVLLNFNLVIQTQIL